MLHHFVAVFAIYHFNKFIGQFLTLISDILSSSPPQTNFITENFREVDNCVHTDEASIEDQLKQGISRHSKPATTYGCFDSSWVDENCYIR